MDVYYIHKGFHTNNTNTNTNTNININTKILIILILSLIDLICDMIEDVIAIGLNKEK